MDDGFSYRIPDGMVVSVGSIVRVPLGGRRVRGWVTALRAERRDGLKEIVGVSGAQPVFHDALLQTLRWAAVHYVSPLAALLPRSAPPNLPKAAKVRLDEPDAYTGAISDAVKPIVAALEAKSRHQPTFIAGSGPWLDEVAAIAGAATTQDRGSIVVLPSAVACATTADYLRGLYGRRVVAATSAFAAADQTRAWSQAAGIPGTIVVGTPEVALWPVADLAVVLIVEEGRRAMKARQTPTLHVRDLLRRRAGVERFGLVTFGHVPTLETLAGGVVMAPMPGRSWPLVEVIDRTQEPPESAVISEATRVAIAGAVRRNEPVFVFVSRRGYAPAFRCTSCGELRRCPQCGANPGRGAVCDRCGVANGPCEHCAGTSFVPLGAAVGRVAEDLRRLHGRAVSAAGEGGLVQVGTERDIPRAASQGLAVVVDIDSMLLRPHYRAEEDTLRVAARVAATVARGRGHRCVVQTRMASHRVVQALRHGNADQLAPDWLREREVEQLPPFGEILAIELGNAPDAADGELRDTIGDGVAIFGPAPVGERLRWLVQAPDLRRTKVQLRSRVQSWRDRGTKVRVDADPLDV